MGDGGPDHGAGDDQWEVATAVDNANRYLVGLGLPRNLRPEGLTGEYAFPDSVGDLTSVQIGRWQLQLTAWHTYAKYELARQESELAAIEETFGIALGLYMQDRMDEAPAGRKPSVLMLKARAIKEDETLTRVQHSLVERRMIVTRLGAQCEIYESQRQTMSREQSRRESEARIG